MTSEDLFNLADQLAGKALRKEPIGPEVVAHIADMIRAAAEMTACMEACLLAPAVCDELAEIMHDAA